MNPESKDSSVSAMAGGAAVGMFVGALFGVLIAWLTGMLQGWNWPFVVFQTALVFAMSFAWTAPLFVADESGQADLESPGSSGTALPDSQ